MRHSLQAATTRRYPAGVGWVVGYALGVLVGLVAWATTGEVTMGVILFAATGTALGAAFEQSVDTRPLTARERSRLWVILVGGVLVGALVLLVGLR
jgi:hypothetical protein